MTAPLRVACLQLSPGNDLDANLAVCLDLLAEAKRRGAALAALPEFGLFLDRSSAAMRASASSQDESRALARLRDAALALDLWLLVGSLVIAEGPDDKLSNRSFLISPEGSIAGRYDKIHLFDARLVDGRVVGESRHYRSGDEAVLVHTPFGRVGMTICYDVRFPALFRRLALAGADILMVPSAFTAETGRAHWDTLLRARAIENGCFVLAPATVGTHPGQWQTYGHAVVIDPWGAVLAQCDGAEVGLAIADLDLAQVEAVRARIPSLGNNPDYALVEYGA